MELQFRDDFLMVTADEPVIIVSTEQLDAFVAKLRTAGENLPSLDEEQEDTKVFDVREELGIVAPTLEGEVSRALGQFGVGYCTDAVLDLIDEAVEEVRS